MTNSNVKKTIQTLKNNLNPHLTIADYIALFILSLKDCFWRIDGRQISKQLLNSRNSIALSGGIVMYIVGYLGWLPLCIMLVLSPVVGILGFFSGIFTLQIFEAIKLLLLGIVGIAVFGTALIFWYIPMVTDWNRLQYNLHFTQTAWWKNTGIRPSMIQKDKGIYGEYIATMAAEQCLKNSHVYGRILNSVFVPKGKNNFNEIDIISVNETGIHVIEAKARGGAFYGNFSDYEWIQKMGNSENTMKNPFIQNLGHCNCLLNYLYSALPEGALRDKATFTWNTINVVLFSTYGIEDHLTYNITPKEFFFGMATGKESYQKLNIMDMYKKRFTKEEVDQIADVLESIAHYTQDEQKQMIQQRELMREERNMLRNNGLLENKNQFFVAAVESTTTGRCKETNILVCHDDGEHLTFLDFDTYLFVAIPSGRPVPLSSVYETFPEALAAYHKIMNTPIR